jgi:formate hydrogenlyase transcriptional activator
VPEFDRFVAELSTQFINLPADRINEAIRKGLCRVCAEIALDRSTLYRIDVERRPVDEVTGSVNGGAVEGGSEAPLVRLPWSLERVLAGDVVCFSTAEEIPDAVDRESYGAAGTKSAVLLPVSADGRVAGALNVATVHAARTWPSEVVERLRVIAGVFGRLLARLERDEALNRAAAEAQRRKDELQHENVILRQEVREHLGLTRLVGKSPAIQHVLAQVQQVAATDSTVLLLGETGTGKELIGSHVHELGPRRSRPMVRVNCAALPATLIESELFGREKGAFTGALARQIGRFELADRSTIFLDEIGDLPHEVQVKLLRVLEERRIERLGSPRSITVDVRVVAATHRNLEERIKDGAFREDLYYRLNVFPIQVPPLRDRAEDIPMLVWRFMEEFSNTFGKRVDTIDKDNLLALQQYSWPGNIRELRNAVERAMILATGRRLTVPVPQSSSAATRRSSKLVDVEREHIRNVLAGTAWRIRGPGGAADRLGLKPTTLETRMAKLGLKRPGHG